MSGSRSRRRLAGWVNALALLALFIRRDHFRFDDAPRRNLPRVGAAALGMGIVLLALRAALEPALAGPPVLRIARAGRLWSLRGWPPLRSSRSPSGSQIGAISWGGCAGNRLDRHAGATITGARMLRDEVK